MGITGSFWILRGIWVRIQSQWTPYLHAPRPLPIFPEVITRIPGINLQWYWCWGYHWRGSILVTNSYLSIVISFAFLLWILLSKVSNTPPTLLYSPFTPLFYWYHWYLIRIIFYHLIFLCTPSPSYSSNDSIIQTRVCDYFLLMFMFTVSPPGDSRHQ